METLLYAAAMAIMVLSGLVIGAGSALIVHYLKDSHE